MDDPRELVTAILAGEHHRFGEIVRSFDVEIKTFVSWFVRDESLRDDVVQETFYKAFKSLDSLSSPDRLESWLKTIARRCLVDQLRRQWRQTTPPTETPAQRDAVVRFYQNDDSTWIWGEVEKLELIHREVLRLRYAEGRSWSEMAQAIGVPVSTVRGRLFEARKALRKLLEDKGLFP